jgi:hypothetical protein
MGEIELQVEEARKNHRVSGSAYYSAIAFQKNLCGLNYSMQYSINMYPSLLPLMPWIKGKAPATPQLSIERDKNGNRKLHWTAEGDASDKLFAVYRFAANEKTDINQAHALRTMVRGNTYTDESKTSGDFRYVVTALDRLHNESAASNEVK